MSKGNKRFLSLLLTLSLLLSCFPPVALAAEKESPSEEIIPIGSKSVTLSGSERCGDNLTWAFADGTLTISGEGAMWDLVEGCPWEELRSDILQLVLWDGVTSIGASAFADMELTGVSIPASCKSIGASAFHRCYSLKTVSFGGTRAQWNSIKKGENALPDFATILYVTDEPAGMIASGKCGESLTWTLSKEGTLTVSGTGYMYSYTDADPAPWKELRTQIVYAAMEDGVKSLGRYAFALCSNLATVDLPRSLTQVDEYAFTGCNSLVTLSYAGSEIHWVEMDVAEMGNESFLRANVNFFYYPISVDSGNCGDNLTWTLDDGGVLTVSGEGEMWDYNCPWEQWRLNIFYVVLEEGVSSISDNAFSATLLKSVMLPASVKSVGYAAFDNCTALKTVRYGGTKAEWDALGVTLPEGCKLVCTGGPATIASGECGESLTWTLSEDGVLTISGTGEMNDYDPDEFAPWALYNDGLSAVVVEEGVRSLGAFAFYYSPLETITLPSTLTGLGQSCFEESALKTVAIPAGVTEILACTFYDCMALESVTLPEGIERIGETAFAYCEALTDINLPDSLRALDMGALMSTALTSVHLGTKLTELSAGALCIPALSTISVDEGNPGFCVENGILYNIDKTRLLCVPAATAGELTIPATVTSIGDLALCHCTALTSVTLPESLVSIGEAAFGDCSALSRLSIPDSVKTIGEAAFSYCVALESVKLPAALEVIPASCFESCTALQSVSIGANVATIEGYVFAYCENLEELTIPATVLVMDYNALSYSSLKTVRYGGTEALWNELSQLSSGEPSAPKLPDGCSVSFALLASGVCGENLIWTLSVDGKLSISGKGAMDDYAAGEAPWWEYREEIRGLSLPEGLTHVGSYAFVSLWELDGALILPEGVTSLGDYAFAGTSPDSISLPESMESIGKYAFGGCYSYSFDYAGTVAQWLEVELGENDNFSTCTIVCRDDTLLAFGDCGEDFHYSLLASGSLRLYGSGAMTLAYGEIPPWLLHVESVKTLTVEEGVTALEHHAFSDCANLTSATLPESLVSVGESTFEGCTALKTVRYGGTKADWDALSVTLPEGCELLCADPCADGHDWGEASYTWNSDNTECTATRSCKNDAAHVETETVKAAVTTVPATCEEQGSVSYAATFKAAWAQSQSQSVSLAALTHDWGEATYTWNSDNTECTATRSCKNDAAHVETETVKSGVRVLNDARCGEAGELLYTAEFESVWCESQSVTEQMEAMEHVWGEVSYTWSTDYSFCTAKRVCLLDATHSETMTADASCVTVASQCEQAGSARYTAVFLDWAETQSYTEELEALGHVWGSPVYTWNADYTECSAVRVCDHDHAHRQSALAQLSSSVLTAPECERGGRTRVSARFEEGWADEQLVTVDTPALGHDWGEIVYRWSEDGGECCAERVCRRDDRHCDCCIASVESTTIADPSCSAVGSAEHKAIFNVDWAVEQSCTVILPARDHNWGEVSYLWSEDSELCTASHVCLNDASHSESQSAHVSFLNLSDARCGESGYGRFTAEFEEDWAETQTHETVVPALGHSWGETVYSWSSDLSACTARHVCLMDESHAESAVAKVSSELSAAPGCDEQGERSISAVFTEDWARTQTVTAPVAALHHNWSDVSYLWSNDLSECSAVRYCLRDESHTETAVATVRTTVGSHADCLTDGEFLYTATFIRSWAEAQRAAAPIPARGHSWGEVSYTWSSDLSECTASRVCLNDPSHVETATAYVSSKVKALESCEQEGSIVYTALFEELWAQTQTATETVSALGHGWVYESTDIGSVPYRQIFRCENCQDVRAEDVPTPKATALSLDAAENETVYLNERESVSFLALALPANAEQNLTWSGMSEDYGYFEQEGGRLSLSQFSGKTGTLSLSVASNDGSRLKKSFKLTLATYAESLNILNSASEDIETATLNGKSEYTFTTDVQLDSTVSDKNIRWSLSSEDYAAVDAKTGKVTVKSFAGEEQTVVLTATAVANEAATDSITLTLVPNLTEGVLLRVGKDSVNESTLTLDVNSGSLQLRAEPVNMEGAVSFKSSRPAAASVDANGLVTLLAPGLAVISAECNGVKSVVTLKIARYSESVTVSGSDTLIAGKAATYTAAVAPADADNKTVVWSLAPGDEAYATLKSGKLSALSTVTSPVTVTLVATAADKHSEGTKEVLLMPTAGAVVVENVPEGEWEVTDALRLRAYVEPLSASQELIWSSSNRLFAIDADGRITVDPTAKAASVSFTAATTDGSGKKTVVKIKFVRAMTAEDLSFPESARLGSGKALTLKGSVDRRVTNPRLVYSMAENEYATLNGSKLSAAKDLSAPVTVCVTATAEDGSGVSKNCYVTLYPLADSVSIDNAPTRSVDISESLRLFASAAPYGAAQDFVWSSSNSKLYPIDEEGRITVAENAKAGTITFTATATDGSGKKASVKVKFVRLMRDEDVTMDTDYVLAAGKTLQFKPTVDKVVTNPKFSYSMEVNAYATLKGDKLSASKTLAEPVTVTVTATAEDGSGVVRELHVTLYPSVKAVHIYNSIGEDVTGKTIDFTGSGELRLSNEPYNAAQGWTVKSGNAAISAELNLDRVILTQIAELKPNTKLTLTFTANDGSGKSAKVNLRVIG